MAKNWDEMSQGEKIEELRSDVLKTMETVNLWIHGQKQLGGFHNDLMKKHSHTAAFASEIAAAVEVLEKKVAKLAK